MPDLEHHVTMRTRQLVAWGDRRDGGERGTHDDLLVTDTTLMPVNTVTSATRAIQPVSPPVAGSAGGETDVAGSASDVVSHGAYVQLRVWPSPKHRSVGPHGSSPIGPCGNSPGGHPLGTVAGVVVGAGGTVVSAGGSVHTTSNSPTTHPSGTVHVGGVVLVVGGTVVDVVDVVVLVVDVEVVVVVGIHVPARRTVPDLVCPVGPSGRHEATATVDADVAVPGAVVVYVIACESGRQSVATGEVNFHSLPRTASAVTVQPIEYEPSLRHVTSPATTTG
jgi:hypothetical protein